MNPRTRCTRACATAAALALSVLAVAGCGSSDDNSTASTTSPTTASGQSATLGAADSDLGTILVDSRGRTLYLFQKDTSPKSTCTGQCATQWPPLPATGKPTTGTGAQAALVSTSARSNGVQQVTYHGHPVYRFAGDKKPGDTTGQGLNAFGGVWYALSPAGNAVTTQSSSTGGSGY